MAIIILEPGEVFEHYHSEVSETDVLRGSVRCAFNGEVLRMHPGDSVTIPADTPHTLENVGSVEAHVGCRHKPTPHPAPPRPPHSK